MSWILGLNAFHADSAACLLKDGVMIAAAEEERFRRVKHWAGFPSQAIAYCLGEAGIGVDALDHVAINQDSRAHFGRKLLYAAMHQPDPRLLLQRLRTRGERKGIAAHFTQAFPQARLRAPVHAVEHHLAHLSSAFHVSPFDEAVLVSVDGFGDFASAAWGVGRGTRIDVHGRVLFPHSLGIFYQAVTQFLGFPHYGDEYKVMGLAPYGQPVHLDAMRRVVRLKHDGSFELDLACFRHHRERIAFDALDGSPRFAPLFGEGLVRLLGEPRGEGEPLTQRHKDIARSAQAMYEEAFFHLLRALHARNPLDALCIAGGCAANSVANGKVTAHTPFRHVYVQAAAGDAGGAVGAAYSVWHAQGGARGPAHDHAAWGPAFGDAAVDALLAREADALAREGCVVEVAADEEGLAGDTADAIARGEVVGWFQGRMEWGPRALGNRSILGDPRRGDMKELLNAKIKRRESFRPFAPSILREEAAAWFEREDDVPFMMQVYPIRQERRGQVPAVTHVDGTGRLQTVTAQANPRYHRLIQAFAKRTGVPIVLNTSFNENEPVVCTPAEALDCFLRTRMDRLVLGSRIVRRQAGTHG